MRREIVAIAALVVVVSSCTSDSTGVDASTVAPPASTPPANTTTSAAPTTTVAPQRAGLREFATEVRLVVDPWEIDAADLPVFMHEYYGGWGVHQVLLVWDDGRFLRLDHPGSFGGIESLLMLDAQLPEPTKTLPPAQLRTFRDAVAVADLESLADFKVDTSCPQSDGVIEEFRFRFDGPERSLVSCIDIHMAADPAIAAAEDFVRWVQENSEVDVVGTAEFAFDPDSFYQVVGSAGIYEGVVAAVVTDETSILIEINEGRRLAGQGVATIPAITVTSDVALTEREHDLLREVAEGDVVWALLGDTPTRIGLFGGDGRLLDAGTGAEIATLGRMGRWAAFGEVWRRPATTCALDPRYAPIPTLLPTAAGALLASLEEATLRRQSWSDQAMAKDGDTFGLRFLHSTSDDDWLYAVTTREGTVLDVISERSVKVGRKEWARLLRPPDGEPMVVWALDGAALAESGCQTSHLWVTPEIVARFGEVVFEIPSDVVAHQPRPIVDLATGAVEYPPPRDTGGEP